MDNRKFFEMTGLQYKNKALSRELDAFKNGEAYEKLRKGQLRLVKYYESRIKDLNQRLVKEQKHHQRMIKNLFEVLADIQDDYEKRLRQVKTQFLKKLDKSSEKIDTLTNKLKEQTAELVATRKDLLDEKELTEKLNAQINQDNTNSSIPSSKAPFRGKVTNNREKTDRMPGAQPGHAAHHRKKLAPTEPPVILDAPEEIRSNPDYYRVSGDGGEIRKIAISVSLVVRVKEYVSYVYRNRKTGSRYHAPFPDNVVQDVNFDESIKALILIMKNHLNLPENKIVEFFKEMTNGELAPSRGFINSLNRKFSDLTQKERQDIFNAILHAKVVNTDMTTCRNNGELKNIVVSAIPEDVLYQYREKKGHDAIVGTPLENFTNTLVSDHDLTFKKYGNSHQECNEHICRYLKGAAEVENDREWHTKMRSLLQEMNNARNKSEGRDLQADQINDFVSRYDEILEEAKKSYEDKPPSEYYRKGFNLYKQLSDFKEDCLLFLYDPEVPFTNNFAEQMCRRPKRHQAVSGTFRGKPSGSDAAPDNAQSAEVYCDVLSVLQSTLLKGGNIWELANNIFMRVPTTKEGNRFKKHTESSGPYGDTIVAHP